MALAAEATANREQKTRCVFVDTMNWQSRLCQRVRYPIHWTKYRSRKRVTCTSAARLAPTALGATPGLQLARAPRTSRGVDCGEKVRARAVAGINRRQVDGAECGHTRHWSDGSRHCNQCSGRPQYGAIGHGHCTQVGGVVVGPHATGNVRGSAVGADDRFNRLCRRSRSKGHKHRN